MRKTAVTLVIVLLVTAVAGLLLVDLAPAFIPGPVILPEITINNDGSISPQTELISRNGSTYTLKANSQEPIVIACSNIVFDGAGHTINITSGDNCGLLLDEVNNVIVRNVKVFSRNIYSIYLGYGSSNCLITGVQTGYTIRIVGDSNNITESSTGIAIFSGSNNLIMRNNISRVLVGSSSNRFFKNNFHLTDYPMLVTDNLWDDGSVGNYWSNYTIKYPNASEFGNTGIGDTPYMIEREWHSTEDYPNAKNVDNHPLMYPYDIENDTIAFPTPDPQPKPEPFPTLFVVVFTASNVVVVAGLLFYRRKRKLH
jgi:hypothetical protein